MLYRPRLLLTYDGGGLNDDNDGVGSCTGWAFPSPSSLLMLLLLLLWASVVCGATTISVSVRNTTKCRRGTCALKWDEIEWNWWDLIWLFLPQSSSIKVGLQTLLSVMVVKEAPRIFWPSSIKQPAVILGRRRVHCRLDVITSSFRPHVDGGTFVFILLIRNRFSLVKGM